MSSVNSSSNRDEISQLREEYRKREAELIKKHNNEIKKLSRTNISNTDALKEQANERIGEVKKQTKNSVSRRDAQYRNEIADLKKFHTKQLERMMRDNETKLQQERSASRAEAEQLKTGKEDRVGELNSKYNQTINSKSKDYNQLMDKMRERQTKSYTDLKENLQKKHEAERSDLRKTYQQQIVKLENDLRTTRYSARDQLKGQEIRHMNDKSRAQEFLMSEVTDRETLHAERQGLLKDNYDKGLDDLRQKNYQQQQDKAMANEERRDAFESQVNERVINRENRLEKKLSDEKQRNIRFENKLSREADQEVQAWKGQYEDKYKAIQAEKKMALEYAKKNNVEDLQGVHKQANDAIANNNRYMRNIVDTNFLKSRQSIDALENEMKFSAEAQKNQADSRIKLIREDSLVAEERLKENYQANLEIIKKQHQDEVRDLRVEMTKDANERVQEVKNQAREREMEHQNKLSSTITKYERELGNLNDRFVREKKSRDNREKQLIESMNKSKEAEKEALVAKYSEKNEQQAMQHRDELQSIQNKHSLQVQDIVSASKKV